jgi:predicted nucleic acid-binding protein
MALSDVPPGTVIAVDANILVYHFHGQSADCTAFLRRAVAGDIYAWTGAHIISELCHRLMILEAQVAGLIVGANPAARLRQRPDLIRQLTLYQQNTAAAISILSPLVPVDNDTLRRSAVVRDRDGLLVNDSLLVAMMELQGTTALATADRDFLRIPGIEVYLPDDLRP